MKTRLFLLAALFAGFISCEPAQTETKTDTGIQTPDTADLTNDFYDDVEINPLPMTEVEIAGEISNPGKVDFSKLEKHSIIVKEALLDSSGGNRFVGAYKYQGYSLYDILNYCKLQKKNENEFPPIIDLYVEVENDKGEKVIFSWGEIYYPNNLHRILIASDVMRIVPTKSKDLRPLPETCKIVAGNDLLTERNISNPVKITVRSYSGTFVVTKDMEPMHAPEITIFRGKDSLRSVSDVSAFEKVHYEAIFYGRGRGIHSTTPFHGVLLRDVLSADFKPAKIDLQKGFFVGVGLDGYRAVITCSELFNRNDQQEMLLVPAPEGEDGGAFRIFPACDFFSDRAVKSLNKIIYVCE
jgi:hypothetical protein